MLAALGHDEFETTAEHARALIGALVIVQIQNELRTIRQMLTPPKK